VVGAPIRHSLSPLIHNAWIAAADLDAVYVPVQIGEAGFSALIEGLRQSSFRGLNVTLPFKEEALRLADVVEPFARAAGAANLLLFGPDGAVEARNTDGPGLLAALDEQAPAWKDADAPVVVLGAGGAARGAVAAFTARGVSEVRVVNRTLARAERMAGDFEGAQAFRWDAMEVAVQDAQVVVNATSIGLGGQGELSLPLERAHRGAVVMDMVYRPLRTALLRTALGGGCRVVDGLAMLIGQARPSFEALFGQAPPREVDVRRLALAALDEAE
jgi:shikimate dehydrogenase